MTARMARSFKVHITNSWVDRGHSHITPHWVATVSSTRWDSMAAREIQNTRRSRVRA